MASVSVETALPQGDVVVHNNNRYTIIKEGLASILVPEATEQEILAKQDGRNDESDHQVFYNPIQQFNRDLSVLAIKAFGQEALEKKTEAAARRKAHAENKKRKRQEETSPSDRPHKLEKTATSEATTASAPDIPKPAHSDVSRPAAETDAPHNESIITESEAAIDLIAEDNDIHPNGDSNNAKDTSSEQPKSSSSISRFKILDALSASGLRALRYAHELPFPVLVTANDLLSSAVDSIKLNVEHNKLQDSITVTKSNALAHMYGLIANELSSPRRHPSQSGKYDVIDLDPYGTAATFFDASVQAVRDGGLLCVTCTDAGVWASHGYSEKAFALYGGIPQKGEASHEAGLRIILHALSASANRYGLAIEPLLSLSIDFYCRIFVRVSRSPAIVKFQAGKTMVVYSCDHGCGAWVTQPLLNNKETPNQKGTGSYYKHSLALAPTSDQFCGHCGTKAHLAGPMYAGHLHSADFIQRILKDLPQASTDTYGTTERIRGMLQTALEELPQPPAAVVSEVATENGEQPHDANKDHKKALREERFAAIDAMPFFFLPQQLARAVHCTTPPENALRGALRRLGYHVTRSHCKPGSLKTNAPWGAIWEVMREWVRQKAPIKEDNIKSNSAAYRLLRLGQDSSDTEAQPNHEAERGTKIEIVFDEKLGRENNKEKLVRYQTNPRENWGPMNRAKGR